VERAPGCPLLIDQQCRDGRRHPLQLAIIASPPFNHLGRDVVIFATISAGVRRDRSSPKSSSARRPESDQSGSVLEQWRHVRPRQPHHKPRDIELHGYSGCAATIVLMLRRWCADVQLAASMSRNTSPR
jgi:hypothetical protein